MKPLLFTFVLVGLISGVVRAQDNDVKKGAQLACKCLDSLSYLSSFKLKSDSCFKNSAVAVLASRDKGKVPSTVEALNTFITDLKAQTYKDCPAYRQDANEEQGKAF